MNLGHPQNQSYWFVLREDQSNVIFSSNNFTIHNPQAVTGQEARYIVDTGDPQFIQIDEASAAVPESAVVTEQPICDENKDKDENTFWDRNKIKLLLTFCLENDFKNFSKDRDLLENFAAHIGTTPEDCSNKYKNLRRTFIRLLKKKRLGKEIKWVHYTICEKVFNDGKLLPNTVLDPWDDYKIRNLLDLYIQNLPRFRNSDCLQKDVWREIAAQIGTTEYICYHKFKNLKRAYLNWVQRSRNTGKPIKWQYQHYFEQIFYNHTPSAGMWNRTKTRQLMDAYLQIADKFKDPRYQKKDLWKHISAIVDESAQNCDRKFRNLKQTYLKLKMRADSGQSITKWRYYKDFESIYSPCSYWGNGHSRSERNDYIKELLQFYVENKDKFRDPRKKKKQVWRFLTPKIGMSPEACDRKFRNLKQTYLRHAEQKALTGHAIKWPYYTYFEKIFDEPQMPNRSSYRNNTNNVAATEVKRAMQQLQKKKDDKFERLVSAVEESNNIQKERNFILKALLDRRLMGLDKKQF